MSAFDSNNGQGGEAPGRAGIEARLEELEIKAAFAEDLVETLNHTVFRQQEQIEVLQRQLDELRRQVQSIPSGGARSLRDEIPPHY